jgi:hypothetical protein
MGMSAPVYLVDASVSGDINFGETKGVTAVAAVAAAAERSCDASFHGGVVAVVVASRGQPNVLPVASSVSNDGSRRFICRRALAPGRRPTEPCRRCRTIRNERCGVIKWLLRVVRTGDQG